jgi:hypothetical protein
MMDFVSKSAAGDTSLTPELQAAASAMVNKVKALSSGNIPKEVQLIEKQRGEALAELAIGEARGQASAWKRIYVDMLRLTSEGRAGFRTVTAKHAKDMRAHVKANNDDASFKKTRASALVRLSELNTITKAIDAGAKMDADWPFHYAVGHARTVLEGAGKSDNRGRPSTSWIDKLKKYVSKNVPADKLHDAAELIETLAAVGNTPAPL